MKKLTLIAILILGLGGLSSCTFIDDIIHPWTTEEWLEYNGGSGGGGLMSATNVVTLTEKAASE